MSDTGGTNEVFEAIRFAEEYGYRRWMVARDDYNATCARLATAEKELTDLREENEQQAATINWLHQNAVGTEAARMAGDALAEAVRAWLHEDTAGVDLLIALGDYKAALATPSEESPDEKCPTCGSPWRDKPFLREPFVPAPGSIPKVCPDSWHHRRVDCYGSAHCFVDGSDSCTCGKASYAALAAIPLLVKARDENPVVPSPSSESSPRPSGRTE